MPIELQNLRPHFLSNEVIESSEVYGTEIAFEKGQRYLIQAPSGKGKSTLMNILYGVQQRYEGQLIGTDNGRHRFSYVFQDLRLFDELSCLENIQIKNTLSGHKSESEIRSMLHRVGLEEHVDKAAGQLSFGQRQRTAIVRSLCMPFDFLLLDEPFSHLDYENARVICTMIDEELKRLDAGLIIAMLDASSHFSYDKVYKL